MKLSGIFVYMDVMALPESKYKKLFDLSPDLLCIAGADGYFKEINPAFSKTLGYSEDELLSKSFLEFIHPDDVESTIGAMDRQDSGHDIIEFENRYKHKDGHYITLSWSSKPDAETGLYFSSARDISARKATEHRLEQLQHMLNEETIIALTDKHGTITEVNDKLCEISGYERHELIGQNHRILSSGLHDKAFFVDMWQTILAGEIWSGTITNRNKDGELYYVQSIITPLLNLEGEITNFMAIRFDVTSQYTTKNELSKTLDILNETSASAKVGGWELEVATGDLTWTDQTFALFELEKQVDQKPKLPEGINLYIPEHQPLIEEAVNRAINDGIPYALELCARTTQGRELWVYTTGKANYIDGKVATLSGTIQDIDDQKTAELKYNLERQKSIHNSKLTALGELSASIAHEINNPLAIIQGSAFLLSNNDSNSEAMASKLQDINKSCDRISRIVHSLKKFSRFEVGKKLYPKSLAEIVEEALLLTENKAKRSHTRIEFICHSQALIYCDEIEIEQIVVNLINNAIDAVNALEEKWIKLTLEKNSEKLILEVSDSGHGIPKHIASQLFEPFYTTKKAGEGTGLGLSIVKGILEDHNATITLDEQRPHTTFRMEFPVHSEEEQA